MVSFNFDTQQIIGMKRGKGYLDGIKAGENINRAKEESGREDRKVAIMEDDSNIRQEDQKWKREAVDKERSIQDGMAEAGKTGGYEGVISFLQEVDPTRALKFHDAKLDLDKKIMRNSVLKATSKNQIDAAMVESYAVLGKMGHAISKAPPEQQQQMYKQFRPMIQRVNPDAPATYTPQAESMLLLATAQAMPANQLFKANATIQASRSRIGQLNDDIENRQANGQTANNNSGLRSMLKERERLEINSQKATLSKAEQTLKAAERDRDDQQKQLDYAKDISEDIEKQSKQFTDFTGLSTKVEGSLIALRKDPSNFPAKSMIGRAIAKMANGVGVLTQPDVDELIKSDASYNVLIKMAQSIKDGKKTQISQQEMEDLTGLYKAMEGVALQKQAALESAHEDQIAKYPGAIDIKNVLMPSQAYKSFKSKMGVDAKNKDESQQFLQKLPKEMQWFAQEALKAGVPIDAIKSRMQQMQQGQGNQ